MLTGCGDEVIECLPNVTFKQLTTEQRSRDYNCYRVNTTFGDIDLAVDKSRAPLHAENFAYYVENNHYNDTIFHRVLRNFVIQGGGVTSDLQEKGGLIGPVINESSLDGALSNQRCSVAAARVTGANTARSQFFINVVDNSRRLDFDHSDADSVGYTVFGHVVNGMDVVDLIRELPVASVGGNFTHVPRLEAKVNVVTAMQCNDIF